MKYTFNLVNLKFLPIVMVAVASLFVTVITNAQTTETGTASYYHNKFIGRKTANGEIFDQSKMTAAHKALPLGTWVKVTNLRNDSTIIVRINDRMPQWNKRAIDLTKTGATKLDFLHDGLTQVLVEIIPNPHTKPVFPIQREELTTAMMTTVNIMEFDKYSGGVVYPKLPVIQYVLPEKFKYNIFNSQR